MLTFERNGSRGNVITLRCVDDLRIPIRNVNFSMRAPGSSSRQPVQHLRGQNGVIMFTLTPETEGYFSCQDPRLSTNELSEELLLAGE